MSFATGRPRTASRTRQRRAPRPATATHSRRSELDLERAFAASSATVAEAATFAELGLPARLVAALARSGVTAPFPIQTRAIPDALTGRDLLGRAQTGSGKTLAFGLPLLARLSETGRRRQSGTPYGLVLVPTRELAQQVTDALTSLAAALDLRVTAVYGGTSIRRQIVALRRGADVVVATPGRLIDLIEQGECSLAQVMITVLDEADYMADLGFLPAVATLLDQTAAGGQRLLFSATLDRGVDKLVRSYLTDPVAHAVAPAVATVTTMDHRVFTLRSEEKVPVAAEIAGRAGRTLFFVRTKRGADRLARQLREAGVQAGAIHGDLAQNARQRALDAFGTGRAPVLVATDVAARGIHVDDVDLVVHFDPPADHKDYLHRAGRTARAGADGTVLSLLLPDQVREAARLRERGGIQASVTAVAPRHPAVREIATSGTPISPRPSAPVQGATTASAPRRRRRPAQQRGGRPAERGGAGRGSARGTR